MQDLIISFLAGFIISLGGSLSPSTMSAAALEITIARNKLAGLMFGLGSAVVEIIYIRLYFLGFDEFIRNRTLFLILEWVLLSIFMLIGIYLFVRTYSHATPRRRKKKGYSEYKPIKAFMLGAGLKAINPLQFIFWTFWSSFLITNDWLQPRPAHYNAFCIGLGLATFLAFVLYVTLGDWLHNKSFFSKNIFRRIIAIFLILTSISWAIKLIINPEGMAV